MQSLGHRCRGLENDLKVLQHPLWTTWSDYLQVVYTIDIYVIITIITTLITTLITQLYTLIISLITTSSLPSSLSSSLPSSFPSSLPSSQPPLHSLKVKTASVFTTTYLQGMFSQSRGFHCNFILNYIFVLPSWWSLDFPHWCKRNLGGTYTT